MSGRLRLSRLLRPGRTIVPGIAHAITLPLWLVGEWLDERLRRDDEEEFIADQIRRFRDMADGR